VGTCALAMLVKKLSNKKQKNRCFLMKYGRIGGVFMFMNLNLREISKNADLLNAVK
jgi:hypothetical protein